MRNFFQDGDVVTVTAPYTVASNAGVLVGILFGIAAADALVTADVDIQRVGVFNINKTSALAISQGDLLYWDDTAKELNKTSTGVPVAVAILPAANPSSTVRAALLPGYSAPIDATILKYAKVSLSNAEIKALRAAPKTLVAAPGTNKLLQFISAVLVNNGGTNALTETTDNMGVKFNDGSGTQVSQDIECTGFIDQTAKTVTTAAGKIDAIVASANAANKALVLHNTGDGEWGGNAAADVTLDVYVTYRVHTIG